MGNVLGANVYAPSKILYVREVEGSPRHRLIVGQSGSGKTQFLLGSVFQDAIRDHGVVFLDGKSGVNDSLSFLKICALAGRLEDVFVFHPGSPICQSVNFLRSLEGINPNPLDITGQILRVTGREPDWEKESAHFKGIDRAGMINAVKGFIAQTGRQFTFKHCYDYFQRLQETGQKDDKFEGILTSMEPFVTEPLASQINSIAPEIRLDEVFRRGKILYIGLGQMDDAVRRGMGMMFCTIFQWVIQNREFQATREKIVPIHLYFEEASAYLCRPMKDIVERARSSQVKLSFSLQNFTQLLDIAGVEKKAFAETIKGGTTQIKVFFRQTGYADSKEAADLLGKKAHPRVTRTSGDDGVSRRSVQEGADAYRFEPTFIQKLPDFQAVVQIVDSDRKTGDIEGVVWTPRLWEHLKKVPAPGLPKRDHDGSPDTPVDVEEAVSGAPSAGPSRQSPQRFRLGPVSGGVKPTRPPPRPEETMPKPAAAGGPVSPAPSPVAPASRPPSEADPKAFEPGVRIKAVVERVMENRGKVSQEAGHHPDFAILRPDGKKPTIYFGGPQKLELRAFNPPLKVGELVECEPVWVTRTTGAPLGWRAKEVKRVSPA